MNTQEIKMNTQEIKMNTQEIRINIIVLLGVIFFVAGLYVAVQEALESTVTAEMVNQDTLAMSIGALGTVNGVAKFISSAAVGVLWTAISPVFSFGLAALLMMGGTLALARIQTKVALSEK
jgi:hypothetical protein